MATPPSTVSGAEADSSALHTYYCLRSKLEESKQNLRDLKERYLTARATAFFLANHLQKHECERYRDLIASVLEDKPDSEETQSAARLGEQASPIQAQVGELAHLQQKLQEGWGACHLFVQHMKNTTKAFEGLIRSTGIASHHGQILREQLVQASQLAESLGRKLTSENHNGKKYRDRQETLAHRENQEQIMNQVLEDSLDERYLTPSGQQNSAQPSSSHTVLTDAQATPAGDASQDEIQIVRYQLKEAMVINDCLRHRMQFHLSSLNRDNGTKGCTSNLYWQVLGSIVQLYDENKVLREKYERLPVSSNPVSRGNN
ncbi:neuroblastoma breakpoint family member 6-like protein [Ochotona curzoniae]|uniref:neuroblastoma breakpoint family member 6-like protein n=1 Tax=Ochotona curzoniae TaxID=130825 RepID=UPI001B348509|nr:neuroblastoma breakpoint family member 6-like protein [Ochotona curzoniae]